MQSSRVEAGNSAVSRHRNLEVQAGTEFVTEKNADLGSAWGHRLWFGLREMSLGPASD